jgi:hypothetical protein
MPHDEGLERKNGGGGGGKSRIGGRFVRGVVRCDGVVAVAGGVGGEKTHLQRDDLVEVERAFQRKAGRALRSRATREK